MDIKGDHIHQYIEMHRKFQENLLNFIDNDDDVEENYQNLIKNYETLKIGENRSELKLFLSTLANIAVRHYHSTNFFKKLEQIINNCKNDILKYFSNTGIYDIFQKSNRILLFLFEEKILKMNSRIYSKLPSSYFYHELKSFSNSELDDIDQETLELIQSRPDEYQQIRKAAVDEKYPCKLIRDDDIDNFIKYINQENVSINEKIMLSQFSELYTSFFSMNYIEYAAYHGSIQIFKYLFKNGANLSHYIWEYAVHGRNQEIFQFLEENKFKKDKTNIEQMFLHAIKCHHNEVAEYIQENYMKKGEKSKKFELEIQKIAIEFFNFQYFPEELNKDHLYNVIKFGYFSIFEYLFKSTKIDFDNNRYLYNSFVNDNLEIFKIIFENSSNVDDNTNDFFFDAIKEEKVQIFEFLLSQKNADVNKKYYNSFYDDDAENESYYKGFLDDYDKDIDIDEIQNELNDNPDHNDYGRYSAKTPLYIAAQKGFDSIVSLLLNNPNIDVNINSIVKKYKKTNYYNDYSDNDDDDESNDESNGIFLFVKKIESPLMVAIRKNHFEIAKKLLSIQKININNKSRIIKDLVYDQENLHYVAYEF